MTTTLTLCDETTGGERRAVITLDLPEPTLTVRELIRSRVYEEVRRFNQSAPSEPWKGLVQPTASERELNGKHAKRSKRIDWHTQVELALDAFESNGFIVLVDDRQVASLDEEVAVQSDTQVSFIKLVPLVGG